MGYSDASILKGASSQAGENHYRISAFFLATSGIVGLGGLLGKEQKELRVKPDFQNTAWKPRYQKQEWSEMKISIENSRIRREEEEREQLRSSARGNVETPQVYQNYSGNSSANYAGGGAIYSPSVEQWRPLVARFTDWNVDTMLRIMEGESHGDPYAWNKTTNCKGLLQIYDPNDEYPYELWTDPWWNIQAAHETWLSQGYEAWEVY